MTFSFNEEYRATDEYKGWVAAIRADYPNLPLYLVEQAILAHKTDPQAYKKDKQARQVFANAPKARVNEKPQIVEGAIAIEDPPTELETAPSVTVEEIEQ